MGHAKPIPDTLSTTLCPWCDRDTPLGLRADGLGGTALWCIECGSKGPTVPITGDFDEADRAAVHRWSIRRGALPRLSHHIRDRVLHMVMLHRVLDTNPAALGSTLSIRTDDLTALLAAAGIAAKE